MKRMILLAIFFWGIAGMAAAQTETGHSSRTTGAVSSRFKNKKSRKPSEKLSNRKIYHFSNGQRSTPSGKEATPVNGGYAALERDTTAKAKRKQ